MVRTKAQARRTLIALSDPCSNDSHPEVSFNPYPSSDFFFWGDLVRTTSMTTPTISQLVVRDPPTSGVLGTPDDYWADTKYYFVRKSLFIEQTWYYRSLKYSYEHRHSHSKPGPYNKIEFDYTFSGLVIGKAPYPLKEKFA